MKNNLLLNSLRAFALFLFVALLSTTDANAVVTQVGSPASTTLTDTYVLTVPAGANRVLIVVASDADATSISSVNYGSSAMTSRVQHTDGVAVDSIWTLSLGTSVSSSTEIVTVVSTGGTPNSVQFIGMNVFAGVDQTTPLTSIQTADSFGSNVNSSLNIISKAGDIVFDIFDTFDTVPNGTRTPGSGQTILNSENNVAITPTFWSNSKTNIPELGGGYYGFYNISSKAGSSLVNVSWTSDDTAMIHIAANINSIAPTAAPVAISGKALTANGNGIKNANVYLTDQNGNLRKTVTGTFGTYVFNDVQVGEDYIVTIVSKRYNFTNPSRVILVQNEISDENFVSDSY